ncbi:MAG TPA: orotate phosphoribosyltransferase [Verrucomicrobiae bacterium]|nr:orotate phosphoribosyltransferase [Verrucomicrobiae bacterium]
MNVLAALQERGALLEGHFRLSSGRHSDRFVQKFRILEDPALLEPIAREIARSFAAVRPTLVVSAAVGGIVLGYEVARALQIKAIFVEKEGGVAKLRRGFSIDREDRVLIVEDVVTTGGSIKEVIEVVRAHGGSIAGVAAIVQRGVAEFGVPFAALLDLPIVSYHPADCPQCKAGEPMQDPGSRRATR